MKFKRVKPRYDSDGRLVGHQKIRRPLKKHEEEDYAGTGGKQTKPQRARHRRRLLEKYGPKSTAARATDYMSTEERRQLRAEVFQAAGYRCELCNSPRLLTLDHVVPRHLGGGNHRANLQCLCRDCNRAKGLDIWAADDPKPFFYE